RGVHLLWWLGRRRKEVSEAARVAGRLEEVHRNDGTRKTGARTDRKIHHGAALRHRADPAGPARESVAELDHAVSLRGRREHELVHRQRRGGQHRATLAAAPARVARLMEAKEV